MNMLSSVIYVEQEEECYKHVMQGLQKKKKNAINMQGRAYRKRRSMLQTCWVGYTEKKEEKKILTLLRPSLDTNNLVKNFFRANIGLKQVFQSGQGIGR